MSKKLILFIVEGRNDEIEISAILHTPRFEQLSQKYAFYFYRAKNDITANAKVKSAQGELTKYVQDFRMKSGPWRGIRVDEIQEIVQIVDLDGAFIPSEHIFRGENPWFEYSDEGIFTKNVDGARGRNKKKQESLNKLVFDVKKIDNIPYSIYFVSCNMDHVLFDQRSLTPRQKEEMANQFWLQCEKYPNILDETVFKDGVATEKSYEESWKEIQQDNKSIERHTNVNLFLEGGAKNSK